MKKERGGECEKKQLVIAAPFYARGCKMVHLVCMAALVTGGIVKMVSFRDCEAGFRTSTMYTFECRA
jgi:hypothetical protein